VFLQREGTGGRDFHSVDPRLEMMFAGSEVSALKGGGEGLEGIDQVAVVTQLQNSLGRGHYVKPAEVRSPFKVLIIESPQTGVFNVRGQDAELLA